MGSCPDTDIDPKIAVSGPVLRICKVMRSQFLFWKERKKVAKRAC